MGLTTETLQLTEAVRLACIELRTKINGNSPDLSGLTTTAKGNLVAAINELAGLIGSGGGGGGGGSSAWADVTGKPAAVTSLSGTNTGDETTATIKTKLSITTLSGSNTGDQTLPTLSSLGAAPLASPTFTGTVTIPSGASISGYLTTATAASTYATLAGPNTFTGANDFLGTLFFDTGTAFNYTPGVEVTHRAALGLVIGTNVLAPNGSGSSLTALNGTQITSGTVPIARLYSSGTPNGTKFLRDDGTLATPAGGTGDMLSVLTSAEISVTTAATLTIGRMHVCTGTSADYTVTLPTVSGNTGKFLGIRMAPALTKLVTVDGNASELIDGSLTRIMWANEAAILYCDGTAWTKVAGKSVPMVGKLIATAAQTFTRSTFVVLTLPSAPIANPSSIADTSTYKLTVLRPGIYTASAGAAVVTPIDNATLIFAVELNGSSQYRVARLAAATGGSSNSFSGVGSVKLSLATGDYIKGMVYCFDASTNRATEYINPDSVAALTLIEDSPW